MGATNKTKALVLEILFDVLNNSETNQDFFEVLDYYKNIKKNTSRLSFITEILRKKKKKNYLFVF